MVEVVFPRKGYQNKLDHFLWAGVQVLKAYCPISSEINVVHVQGNLMICMDRYARLDTDPACKYATLSYTDTLQRLDAFKAHCRWDSEIRTSKTKQEN